MPLPTWIERAVSWLTSGLVVVVGAAALLVTIVVPYRLWDSLAFGAWSKEIALSGDLFPDSTPPLFLQRPLFYVAQGLAWRWLPDGDWIGRLLAFAFAAVLVWAIWALARKLPADQGSRLYPALAVAVVLASPVVAKYAVSGMTDVPVAAMVAATAAVAWAPRLRPHHLAIVSLLACGTMLAKPTGILGLVGLAAALVLVHGRAGARAGIAIAVGVGGALVYDLWQASRLGISLTEVLTAGNDSFWVERAAPLRKSSVVDAQWLGFDLRLLAVFGLTYGAARALGTSPRRALVFGSSLGVILFIASLTTIAQVARPTTQGVVLTFVLLLVVTVVAVTQHEDWEDPLGAKTYRALLVWLAPTVAIWTLTRPDELRLLSPAWAPLALVLAAALLGASLSLARARPAAALAPFTVVLVLAILNLPNVDGLSKDGWRTLLELGPAGWRDQPTMERFALGEYYEELVLAREAVGETGRVVTGDGRLSYFFPGRVDVHYARTCRELRNAKFFVYLTEPLSLEHARRLGQPTDPLAWLQCSDPRLELVGEKPDRYAAFVVGSTSGHGSGECRITSHDGQLLDAVFAESLPYGEARRIYARLERAGYGPARIERTSCSRFRVVFTGIPFDPAVQREFREEARRRTGFEVTYVPAVRYPVVPDDVAAVR